MYTDLKTSDVELGETNLSPEDVQPPSPSSNNSPDTISVPRTAGTSKRRRSSTVQTVRRYSDADLSTFEAFYLANALCEQWDVDAKGYVTPDEVSFEKVDPTFSAAIARIVGFGSGGKITVEHVAECISVLKRGPLNAKVKLLVHFMDSDGSGTLSYDEIKEYLRVADNKMMERLGISINAKSGKPQNSLSYEDILSLFQVSERGNEAMTVFCDQILRILASGVKQHASETLSRRNSVVSMAEDQSNHCLWINIVSGWILEKYLHIKKSIQYVNHVQIFKVALTLLQIFLWLWYFFYYKNRGFPLAFCIAKGFGLNLRILSLLVYATMARTAMGQMYTLKLIRPLIPLGINIEVHSFLGFSIFMHAFGHTFGHIAYKEMHTSKGFSTAFTQNSLLRGDEWEQKMRGDGKTGFLLLAFIIIMAVTALFRSFSSRHYKWFNLCHFLYLLYLPMLFLHVPYLWPYFLAIGALMIFERSFDLFQNTLYTTLSASRPCANGITFLSVPRYGTQTYPGSYYRIRIPSISTEWHPFSLAGSASSHRLYFYIASAGDWTRSLHDLVSDPVKRELTLVQVQGPFLAPASQALVRKPNARILCVASGIGITPFFSMMATKVADEVNYDNERRMYQALFSEGADGIDYSIGANRNSLIEILQKRRKLASELNPENQTISVSKENSDTNLTENTIISATRRNTGTLQILEALLRGSSNLDQVGNHESRNNSGNVSRTGSNSSIINRTNNMSGGQEGIGNTNIGTVTPNSPVPPTAENIEAHDIESAFHPTQFKQTNSATDKSILKVVWSIRELSELSFYVDYVHHLVKAQEQLLPEDDTENEIERIDSHDLPPPDTGDESKDQVGAVSQEKKKGKPRVVVEVDVYLTGLGNKSDPVYMLSQTLFLLSIAHTSSTYMKIHFGRPDLDKIVRDFFPKEVYYCGGNALKSKLSDVCRDRHIDFHPEDFDAGGGDFVRGIQALGGSIQKYWHNLFHKPTHAKLSKAHSKL